MKQQLHIFLVMVLMAALTGACKKYYQTTNDLTGNNYIAGVAYLDNDYSADGTLTRLNNHKIQIHQAGAGDSTYLYSVTTDSNGLFILPNLRDNIAYTVFAQDTVGGVAYFGSITETLLGDNYPITNAELILKVDSMVQNGFVYTVTDSAGDIVANCTVCVYSNPLLYNQNPDSCYGAIFQLTTNAFGKTSQFNVHAATYLTQFKAAFGGIKLTGTDPGLPVKASGVVRHTILVGRH